MLTLNEVKKTLARVGAVIKRTEFGEYRVNVKGGKEATAYYTNDLKDAELTGLAMGECAEQFSATHEDVRHAALLRVKKCFGCGSTIGNHHTALCESAGPNAIRDLPAVKGTQWWNGERPQ